MDGDVARDTLIRALRAGGVTVVEGTDPQGNASAKFVKGDLTETQFLPEVVPHRLAMRLLCKFGVNRDWAWHPERIPSDQLPPPTITH